MHFEITDLCPTLLLWQHSLLNNSKAKETFKGSFRVEADYNRISHPLCYLWTPTLLSLAGSPVSTQQLAKLTQSRVYLNLLPHFYVYVCMCMGAHLCHLWMHVHICVCSYGMWCHSSTLFNESEYSGLNENVSHWLVCLNTWFQVGETIWEALGSVVLLQDLWHYRRMSVTEGRLWSLKSPCHSGLALCLMLHSNRRVTKE